MIQVLDHGEVEFIDKMGDDYRILQSARVSTGGIAKKGDKEDRGLIRYLYKNQHLSPFEQVQLTFRIKCPIFVARQWFRHRTACISGNSKIHLAKNKTETIQKLYELQSIGRPYSFSGQVWKNRFNFHLINDNDIYNCKEVSKILKIGEKTLRKLVKKYCSIENRKSKHLNVFGYEYKKLFNKIINGELSSDFNIHNKINYVKFLNSNNEFEYTPIHKIYRNGIKPVYEITTETGKKITCTTEHRFLTQDGFKSLKEIANPEFKNNKTVYNKNNTLIATNGEYIWQNKDFYINLNCENKTIDQLVEETGINISTLKKWMIRLGFSYKKKSLNWSANTWNKGKTYSLGSRLLSDLWIKKNKEARSGEKSNFWKGGVTKRRLNADYDNWYKNIKNKIFEKYKFKCQLCGSNENLQLHHIIPFYMDEGKIKDENNLIPICKKCHTTKVNNHEEIYIDILSKISSMNFNSDIIEKISEIKKGIIKKRAISNKKIKWVKIENISYIGEKEVFDLGIEREEHNYVANGIITHNSYNEYSGRYSEMIDDLYMPDELRVQGVKNHQGSGEAIDSELNKELKSRIGSLYSASHILYEDLLSKGVAKEMARMATPVSNYTEFYFTVDLRNLFHFLELRLHEHAQYEIRVYAQAIMTILNGMSDLKWSVEIFKEMTEINYLILKCIDKDMKGFKSYLERFVDETSTS